MEDHYQYPVFFECPSPDAEQRKRIEKYFQIRRQSGGGECGSLKKIDDKVCCIAFRELEVQQRVLQKSEHVLESGNGPVVLTVRGSQEQTCMPKLNFSPTQHPILTPSADEYELQPDVYLLRYLKDCQEAWKDLEKELTSVACSAQLYPEEGRVLVQCLAPPGVVDEGRNWKARVDELFSSYLCHYEVDPHKVKALLEPCSSHQGKDEVKVYSLDGMAVVVGERSQVNRLMGAEVSHARRGSSLIEKQTRRLGEAKLRLLWREIEQGLGRDFPGVKVTQADAGKVVLEGSVEEILRAGDWISAKEDSVLERTVSEISPSFLAFLRKVYGGPGALGDFLGVGDTVEVELRDTELRFFTLHADKVDDAEKKLKEMLREVMINVPNCSAVPPELRQKLKAHTSEMNKWQNRVQLVFGSNNTVCLLGHTQQVEELCEAITQFILDHANIEGNVILPFPGLVQGLLELLTLHKFDLSGVTLHPVTSSSEPMVMLEGPSNKVAEVRTRLVPFLASLVQNKVAIDLPGAVRYFESPSGRENILSVTHSHKCLVQHHSSGQHSTPGGGLSDRIAVSASYSVRDGLRVLVCQGDITKQHADALVNAANEDLDHGGGVAAALSKAGGPEVQRESSAIVKHSGKIPTGEVRVTTGGNLNCKKLLHAVGPIGGKSGGRERALLGKTVRSALGTAEMLQFKSIAMPCISSGVFGVPVPVCAEAIVTAVKEFGGQGGGSLSTIVLIDNRREVVRELQVACERLLRGSTAGNDPRDFKFQEGVSAQETARGATAGAAGDCVDVEIIQGTIETQQVDALGCPMAGHDPRSSRVGHCLSQVVGPQLAAKFHNEAGGATIPGDIVLVEGLSTLQSKRVFFLNLIPWDNNQHGTAVKVLRQCIRKILASCQDKGFSSVALPVLGTGAVLRFPPSVASRVLLEEIREFERTRTSRTSLLVRIVIHPSDKDSSKAFQTAQGTLHLRGFTNDANPDQASFYRHVAATDAEVTSTLGAVRLQIVRGDIAHESTDAIINTTDFSRSHSGVSKSILTAAGPSVQAQLAQVGTPPELMCTTGPGFLACREIIHSSFKCDPQLIRKNCAKILKQCETKGYLSAAFPAINTGAAGMDYVKACNAMLDGMTSAITDIKPSSLSLIRIVIMEQPVFQVFSSELQNRFGQTAVRHLTMKEKAKQKLKKVHHKLSKTSKASAPQGEAFMSIKPPPATMSVISCGRDCAGAVQSHLEGVLRAQLVEREVDVHQFSSLDAMELEAVQAKVKGSQISLEHRRRGRSDGAGGDAARTPARDRPGSERDVYVLRGLKEDVLSVIELVNRAYQEQLCQDLRDKEEAMLALSVQWSMRDVGGAWHELSLRDNHALEEAHLERQVSVDDVTAPDGAKVTVNLKANEATNWHTGVTYKVKRSECETKSLELPDNWEPMDDQVFKKVELQPHSAEYKAVAQGFLQTAKYNILKIERVQNVYLWHAYTVCRQRILTKNGPAELGERTLYHGTSAESCNCIERDRFDRSFAGAHATAYGKGVYFAVQASYSAHGYSRADVAGLKRLYVARVLTGRYTVGSSSMKAAPPRGSDPTDCFDSLVNNQQQPAIFVVFHDDQAYPEYLITFK